jgi:hypothetical protein
MLRLSRGLFFDNSTIEVEEPGRSTYTACRPVGDDRSELGRAAANQVGKTPCTIEIGGLGSGWERSCTGGALRTGHFDGGLLGRSEGLTRYDGV